MLELIKRIFNYPELEKEIDKLEKENRSLRYQKTKYKNKSEKLSKKIAGESKSG